MDRRPTILFVALIVLGAMVTIILISRGGGDDGGGSLSAEPTAEKPTVAAGKGPAPKSLEVEDLVEGEGEGAEAGDTVSVQYVGVLYKNGKEFDSNWGSGQPFEFELGSGNVIPGWDQGLVGMKVGGTRELTIPADLAYGAQGSPPAIPPNSALIFEVELLGIE